jgi:hypothetical protein
MKKMIIKTLGLCFMALGLSSFSNAKVSDFHSLITENISAQQELHGEIKKQMKQSDQAFKGDSQQQERSQQAQVWVDDSTDQVNSPTSTRLLRYNKEKSAKMISRKKQMDRISQEFAEVE